MTSKYETESKGYTMITVMQEAARCLLCHDAPCSQACPAHTNPAKFIRSVLFRNVKGAAETIRENNALGSICARVCPTERYCEKACTRAEIDGSIDIGGIQRYVTDMERKMNMKILKAGKPNGMSIAIIGSGPSGLQAATTLREKGYAVDIYEKAAKAGGYLTYGIPEYRLPEEIVDYEVQRIVDLGAHIIYNTTVGKDISMDDLKARYNAVIVAIGTSEAKMLPMFEHNICTESAISFLARAKESKGNLEDLPQNVLVIGGEDVAVGTNPELCKKNCEAVKRGTSLPVLAKMTPNITTMVPVVKACLEGGADGFSAINTVKSIVDVDLKKKVGLPNIDGKSSVSGLSGKAVKPIALRFLQQLRSAAGLEQLPISGIGGIETWEDAAEFILLGATTLQVTTAIMEYGYRIIDDLTNGLMHYMEEQHVDHLQDLVDLANKNIIPTNQLDRNYKVYPKIDWDKCIGCGRCFISCQDGAHQALTWDDEKRQPVFDKSKCVGCQLCALVYPVGAIKLGLVEIKPGHKGNPAEIDVGSQRLHRYHSVKVNQEN
ncbi:NAD-dependent dihydropyrimidine dehydrogenase subunit PreA [Limosilactobacillus reuteri]|uniref:NAD-dependent dihydropyrimidine dehydrogenase subunit PreA n=1 Tax=Limosilactobacillus reuteri TaxID=1598 RepID=UPI00351528E8